MWYRRAPDQGDSLAQYSLDVPHDNRPASTKKAGISAGLVCWSNRSRMRSVSRDARAAVAAEAVVDTQSDQVHVLGDPAVEHTDEGGIVHRE